MERLADTNPNVNIPRALADLRVSPAMVGGGEKAGVCKRLFQDPAVPSQDADERCGKIVDCTLDRDQAKPKPSTVPVPVHEVGVYRWELGRHLKVGKVP